MGCNKKALKAFKKWLLKVPIDLKNYDLLLVGSDRRFVKSRPEKGSNCKARGKPLASITC